MNKSNGLKHVPFYAIAWLRSKKWAETVQLFFSMGRQLRLCINNSSIRCGPMFAID
ncbi:MAG: hypothetical protein ACPF9S_01005 [Candidatus Poseidoniaceae archaeon]